MTKKLTIEEESQILKQATAIRKKKRELTKQQRKKAYEERINNNPLPDNKFRVIYADPPWQYGNSGLPEYGHAATHYNTMSIKELCSLPVKELTEKNCVLFLWVTSPMLEVAFDVIKAWGFKYKSSFVWDKIGHNFGYYCSVRHEFLLIATKGSCLPDNRKLYDSVISIKKTKHSVKPEEFRKVIDDIYTGRKIELFARGKKIPQWETWGNETTE